MTRLLQFGMLLLVFSGSLFAQSAVVGFNGQCSLGGQAVLTQNTASKGTVPIGGTLRTLTSGVLASYPKCLVSVFFTGTKNPAAIFSDRLGTPLSVPFTANTDGSWLFFASPSAGYDIVMSGAGMPTPLTLTDVNYGGSSGGGGSGTVSPCATTNANAYYQVTGATIVCDPLVTDDGAGNLGAQSLTLGNPAFSLFVNWGAGPQPPPPGANTVTEYAPASIVTPFSMVKPPSAGSTNQVLAVSSTGTDSNGHPIVNLGFSSVSGVGSVTGSGTANTVTKFTAPSVIGNTQMTDDGTNPVKSPNGFDVSVNGGYDFEVPNNTVTGTTAQMTICDDGAGKGIICPHVSSTTNQPIGFAVSGAGTAGNVVGCNLGWCTVKFDNSTTARHYAINSTTVDGELHDNGTTLAAGQANYFIWTANGGIGNPGVVRMLIADDFNNSSPTSVYKLQINGTALTAGDTVNLNNTPTPALDANSYGITVHTSKSGATDSVAFELTGDGTATDCLLGTGIFGACVPTQYKLLHCEAGLGDGLNAIPAGTYVALNCHNNSAVTWTITGISCFTDNTGTSTLAATNNAGTALLTGAVTCTAVKSTGGAPGSQSATTTLAAGDGMTFSFVSDGTTKTTTWFVTLTQ